MFEGKQLRPEAYSAAGDTGQQGESLRVMSWSDLVARLAAVRDLRAELATSGEEVAASFGGLSSHSLTTLDGQTTSVNPEDSGNLNRIDCTMESSTETDADGPPAETRGLK